MCQFKGDTQQENENHRKIAAPPGCVAESWLVFWVPQAFQQQLFSDCCNKSTRPKTHG